MLRLQGRAGGSASSGRRFPGRRGRGPGRGTVPSAASLGAGPVAWRCAAGVRRRRAGAPRGRSPTELDATRSARDLPAACDLLAVCLAAGVPVGGALAAVGGRGRRNRSGNAARRGGALPARRGAAAGLGRRPAELAPAGPGLVRAVSPGRRRGGGLRSLAPRSGRRRGSRRRRRPPRRVWVLAPLGSVLPPRVRLPRGRPAGARDRRRRLPLTVVHRRSAPPQIAAAPGRRAPGGKARSSARPGPARRNAMNSSPTGPPARRRASWAGAVGRASAHGAEAGMSTAEYAVGTVAACAFAAVLYRVVTGGRSSRAGPTWWSRPRDVVLTAPGAGMSTSGRRCAQDGMVTAETAVVLPVLLLVLAGAVAAMISVGAQLRCVDAAREGARAAARGDAAAAGQRWRHARLLPAPRSTIGGSGDQVRVTVSVDVAPLGPLPIRCGSRRRRRRRREPAGSDMGADGGGADPCGAAPASGARPRSGCWPCRGSCCRWVPRPYSSSQRSRPGIGPELLPTWPPWPRRAGRSAARPIRAPPRPRSPSPMGQPLSPAWCFPARWSRSGWASG